MSPCFLHSGWRWGQGVGGTMAPSDYFSLPQTKKVHFPLNWPDWKKPMCKTREVVICWVQHNHWPQKPWWTAWAKRSWPEQVVRVEFLRACNGMRSGVDLGKSTANHFMSKTWMKHTSFLPKHHQPELSHMATPSCKRSWKIQSFVGWPYAQVIFYYHGRQQEHILWNSFLYTLTLPILHSPFVVNRSLILFKEAMWPADACFAASTAGRRCHMA